MKVKVMLKTQALYSKLEKSIDFFKSLESSSIVSVDMDLCIKDYMNAMFIYDQTLFESTVI